MEINVSAISPETNVATSAHLAPGRMLHGRYCVERIIAITNANAIYAGTDLPTGQRIVIKCARHGLCSYGAHSQACSGLVSEGLMLAHLRAAHILAPHFLAQLHVDGRPYLVTTRIPGQTLASMHRAGQLCPSQMVRYAIRLCQSLQAVHQIGYVHHDVKPANIIIHSDNSAVLIDWGAAQHIRAAGDYRPENTGTLEYASPEQARGEARPRNDIFALAMTLDELIPYPSDHLKAIIWRATQPPGKCYAAAADFKRALSRLFFLNQLVGQFGLIAI